MGGRVGGWVGGRGAAGEQDATGVRVYEGVCGVGSGREAVEVLLEFRHSGSGFGVKNNFGFAY